MRVDIHQPGLNIGNARRVMRGLGFVQQACALEIGFQYDLDEAFRTVRCLLRETADTPARRDRDGAGLKRQFAPYRTEQRRFTDAVAPDEADARAGDDLRRAVIDQKPSGNPD